MTRDDKSIPSLSLSSLAPHIALVSFSVSSLRLVIRLVLVIFRLVFRLVVVLLLRLVFPTPSSPSCRHRIYHRFPLI